MELSGKEVLAIVVMGGVLGVIGGLAACETDMKELDRTKKCMKYHQKTPEVAKCVDLWIGGE